MIGQIVEPIVSPKPKMRGFLLLSMTYVEMIPQIIRKSIERVKGIFENREVGCAEHSIRVGPRLLQGTAKTRIREAKCT
jgi:hypothetical protein